MRLSPRSRILLLLAAFAALAVGGYSFYWRDVALRLASAVVAWAQQERMHGIDASWRKISVAGYPFSFRIEAEGLRFRNSALHPSPQIEIPSFSATARSWDLRNWQISAPQGLAALPFGRATPRLSAAKASGLFSLPEEGGSRLSLKLEKAGGAGITIENAALTLALPSRRPQKDSDTALTLAIRLQEVKLPFAVAPFGATVAELSLRSAVKGAVSPGPFVRMAEAWRDAGGTIDFDHFRLDWGALQITGSGTLALDQELQPEGAFSTRIEGYDQLVSALVASGRMDQQAGNLVRIALALLAKRGPDGKSEIATSLAIEHGEISLGPARLGRLPHLSWATPQAP